MYMYHHHHVKKYMEGSLVLRPPQVFSLWLQTLRVGTEVGEWPVPCSLAQGGVSELSLLAMNGDSHWDHTLRQGTYLHPIL
jgi:hypothetical protein